MVTTPARYAKFIAAVLGEAITYTQLYGITWHLQAFLVMAGAALAVLGVPNAAARAPEPPSGGVRLTRGGYTAGDTDVKDLPPPPPSASVTPPPGV